MISPNHGIFYEMSILDMRFVRLKMSIKGCLKMSRHSCVKIFIQIYLKISGQICPQYFRQMLCEIFVRNLNFY